MSEQALMALIQLMTAFLTTEGISAEDKKVAGTILSKSLALIEKNISEYHAKRVSNIQI